MVLKRIILISLFPVLLAACSVTYEYAIDRYRNSKVCCRDISEFEYERLSAKATYIADINEKSPSFNFATGKSYYISLELPPYKQVYKVAIKSYALGEHIDKSHIFFPKILLLGANYSVLSEVHQSSFKVSKASFGETAKENKWGLPVKLEGFVTVDDPKVKYMIILTTDSLLSSSTSYRVLRSSPVILPGLVGTLPLYHDPIEIPHSPFGRIVVRIVNE